MIIEVSTHGASIHKKRERFVIKIPEQKDVEIPAEKIESIMVSANAMISTAAMKLCIERQIQLVISSYYGNPLARMWQSSPGRQTQIRRQQYLNQTTHLAYEITKDILLQKLSKQKRYLHDLKNNRQKSDLTEKIQDTILYFNKTISEVKNSLTIKISHSYSWVLSWNRHVLICQ